MIRIVFHFSIRVYWKDAPKDSKNRHLPKQDNRRFGDEAEAEINAMTCRRGKSTVDNYHTALRSFLCYAGEDILVTDIRKETAEGWQQWLKGRGITLNTISCYMRSLRVIVSKVCGEAVSRQVFNTVFTGNTRTDKRSVPPKDISRLRNLTLAAGSQLAFVRDLFLFCLYALGMPLVDVAFLRKKQMNNGYIEYQRHKTSQRIRIKVERPMQQIINRYTVADSPFVFPILNQGTIEEYEKFRNHYNRLLHRLSEMAGISRTLTSYVARHSWASMAYSANVDLPVISKALGHTSSKTTQVYIREIDDSRIDQANRKLLNSITSAQEVRRI